MVKLLVIPQSVLEQFQTDGVQFTKLLDTNYIASVASVSDLADIHDAMNKFPFSFCQSTDVELADSPITGLAKAAEVSGLGQHKAVDLHNRVEGRIASNALMRAKTPSFGVYDYTLYPVDENLWVAVQQRLHGDNGDPARLSSKLNLALFDSMINELLRTRTFESVAATKLFTNYLEASAAR
jgi:hypothetical protein